MFDPRYFSPRYWARRFWPGGRDAEAAVAPPRRRQRPDQRIAVIVAVAPGPVVAGVTSVTPRRRDVPRSPVVRPVAAPQATPWMDVGPAPVRPVPSYLASVHAVAPGPLVVGVATATPRVWVAVRAVAPGPRIAAATWAEDESWLLGLLGIDGEALVLA